MTILINKSDLIANTEIFPTIKDQTVNRFVKDAQLLDLRPQMGEEFFFDFMQNISEQKNQDIFNEKIYSYNNNMYLSSGIKEALIQYAYARIIKYGSYVSTPFGVQVKDHRDSRETTLNEKNSLFKQHQSIAAEHMRTVFDFIKRNKDQYPLFNICCGSTKRKFKMSVISNNKNNYKL